MDESSLCNDVLLNVTIDEIEEHQYSPTERIIITIVMPWILVFGLIGNLGFLFVLWRVTWMRTTLNFFLSHLAVADILHLTVAVSEKVIGYLVSPLALDKYFLGTTGCVLVPLVLDICYFASVSLVTLVTLERYYATCRPHVHREHSTRARPVRLVFIVWFCSLILACMIIPSNCVFFTVCLSWPDDERYANYPEVMGVCLAAQLQEWLGDYADALHSVPFVFAMSVNIVFFTQIIRALNSMVTRAQRSGFSDRSQHIRDRVTRMLVINGIIFFVCLAPFQITALAYLFMPVPEKSDFVWMRICRLLLYVNSAVNPVIYNITNPRYRQAFKRAFTTRRGHGKLKSYLNNRQSSNLEMNNRGNTNTKATFNSNAQTSSQQVKTMATGSC